MGYFADLPMNAIADGHLSWDDSGVQAHIQHLDCMCEWYECDHRLLYIVDPTADGSVHGPDNEMSDTIHEALQQGAPFHRLEEHVVGLAYISYVLRRFNIVDGFYHS